METNNEQPRIWTRVSPDGKSAAAGMDLGPAGTKPGAGRAPAFLPGEDAREFLKRASRKREIALLRGGTIKRACMLSRCKPF
ncbi:hypothetical protein JCM14124_25640 [Humidesulfovibrio idahonensis]